MTTEDAFLQAIFASPEDAETRLVFADWLEDRGDPRAEVVRLEARLARLSAEDTDRLRLAQRQAQLRRSSGALVHAWDCALALARIPIKLERLRRADRSFAVFGAEEHRYQLEPCLTKDAVVSFEQRLGVQIPGEYRAFVLRVGNGGAGPEYGVHPLRADWDIDGRLLDRPFPITNEQTRDIIARQRQEYYRPELDYPLPGCLELADAGCGIVAVLVVVGEQRGTVWYGGDGLSPCASPDGRQANFLQWYESWLDHSLAVRGQQRRRV
jgi:uncharacterized protein (TIGR02996 family)